MGLPTTIIASMLSSFRSKWSDARTASRVERIRATTPDDVARYISFRFRGGRW